MGDSVLLLLHTGLVGKTWMEWWAVRKGGKWMLERHVGGTGREGQIKKGRERDQPASFKPVPPRRPYLLLADTEHVIFLVQRHGLVHVAENSIRSHCVQAAREEVTEAGRHQQLWGRCVSKRKIIPIKKAYFRIRIL